MPVVRPLLLVLVVMLLFVPFSYDVAAAANFDHGLPRAQSRSLCRGSGGAVGAKWGDSVVGPGGDDRGEEAGPPPVGAKDRPLDVVVAAAVGARTTVRVIRRSRQLVWVVFRKEALTLFPLSHTLVALTFSPIQFSCEW